MGLLLCIGMWSVYAGRWNCGKLLVARVCVFRCLYVGTCGYSGYLYQVLLHAKLRYQCRSEGVVIQVMILYNPESRLIPKVITKILPRIRNSTQYR